MILYFISIVGLVISAGLAQHVLPNISFYYDARILVLPLVFLCASVTISPPAMLILAFMCGFLWDAQNLLGPHGGDPNVYADVPSSMQFGYSIILYAAMGFLMLGVQPLFREGKWHISVIVSALSIILYLVAEYMLIGFVRGGYLFNRETGMKILYSALSSMLLAPFIFKILFQLATACRYQIRFDGLEKRRRLIID